VAAEEQSVSGVALAHFHPESGAPTNVQRYPQGMATSPKSDAADQADIDKAAEAICEVMLMKQQFIGCHEFLSKTPSDSSNSCDKPRAEVCCSKMP
jgi:hypothetical protein